MIQNHKTCALHRQMSLEIRGERGMEIAPFCDFVVGVFLHLSRKICYLCLATTRLRNGPLKAPCRNNKSVA